MSKLVVAIDGPVGSGKSTIARLLAKRLDYLYIDTGAMYRAVTLKAMRSGVNLDDPDIVAGVAENAFVELVAQVNTTPCVKLDGVDVTDAIRLPEVSRNTSSVCDSSGVRDHMVRRQREMGAEGGVVMEGRDIGSVVFPDAKVKFFLDADLEIRARRRLGDFEAKDIECSIEKLKADINERDRRDRIRPVGALKKCPDAIPIDSTELTIEEVVDLMLEKIKTLN